MYDIFTLGFLTGGITIAIALILIYNFSNWTKWEIVEENKKMEMVQSNAITGIVSRGTVFVDVLKKTHLKNGKVKYKSVPRS